MDKELKKFVRLKEAELSRVSAVRAEQGMKFDREGDSRLSRDVDYARVLYSSSFRRLQGKMQLFAPGSLRFHRNRLTHSLEVAQVTRSIAQRLKMNDSLTVQTCALAHDLGNPPFGHAGEDVLAGLGDLYFEGNAQTFRILRWLVEKHHKFNGLNLTIRTLLGVCKYPNTSKQDKRKHLYEEPRSSFVSDIATVNGWAKQYKLELKTIDCQVMDLADEIAYAAHDLEDALRQRFFSIDDLLHEFKHSKDYGASWSTLNDLVDESKKFAMLAEARGTADEFNSLFMKELASRIVHELICDIGLVAGSKGKDELGYLSHAKLADGLKRLTFKAVKLRPDVMRYERLGANVIQGLFTVYMDRTFNKDMVLLPANFRVEDKWERKVKDYISGMMDSFAIEQYERYYGLGSSTKLYHP